MREVSRRQIKLIKFYFGDGLPASKSAALAGYRGSTEALCNATRRVLLKFLENPQRFIDAIRREALHDWREMHLRNLRVLREKLEQEERGGNH
jgi:hypothetical protein